MDNMKKLNYKHTISACFVGYIVQAIVCNFAPLLFVGWNKEFNISLVQLTSIITVTFFTQIVVDLIATKYADKVGYKNCLLISHGCSFLGFVLLAILPYTVKNVFAGIMASVMLYSIGSGLLEVLISPVVESCPTSNKAGAMSLLHSFYCWGSVLVIGASTLYMAVFGRENWRYLSYIWAGLALLNGIFFYFVPIKEPTKEDAKRDSKLFKSKFFYIAIILMICAGAAELAMSQWASTFAENGLHVSKTVGDLAGPMAFAILMGTGRVIFSKVSSKINIKNYLCMSAVVCIIAYLMAGCAKNPIVSLIGCAMCGLAVSAMWPGTISLSTDILKSGSTMLFGILALSGDVGCTMGPTLIGYITNLYHGDFKKGLLFAIMFPVIILISILGINKKKVR